MTTTPRTPAAAEQPLIGRLALETPLGGVLTEARVRLLEAIGRCGSLNRAAREVPLSYKAAWDALDAMNRRAPEPLVERSTGGSGGGGTRLTPYAQQLIRLYRAMESSQQDILDRLGDTPAQTTTPAALRTQIRRLGMKTSARNQFPARVTGLSDRGGLVDVTLQIGGEDGVHRPDTIVATITPASVESMGLALGREVYALLKAPSVQVSATSPRHVAGRNVLAGRIRALQPGQTHTAVTLALPGGADLSAVITNARAAALSEGLPAWGVFAGDSIVLVSFG
jgi:molybdate transport system regulatory protein